MLFWPDKDPDEVADYEIDWLGRLDGDTINVSVWDVPTGITKSSDTYNTGSTTIWLSGGVAGETYVLVNRVTTQGGRTFEETVQISVVGGGDQLVGLPQAKRHLRVYHDDDDDEIKAYLAAAITIVGEYVDRVIYVQNGATPSGDDGTALEITPAITAAVLLLLGDLYENREADPESKGNAVLPRAVRALLAPYRVWRVIGEGC